MLLGTNSLTVWDRWGKLRQTFPLSMIFAKTKRSTPLCPYISLYKIRRHWAEDVSSGCAEGELMLNNTGFWVVLMHMCVSSEESLSLIGLTVWIKGDKHWERGLLQELEHH